MSRSTATIVAELDRWLPRNMRAARPVYAGMAAAVASAEAAVESAAEHLEIGTADGEWLDLLARGMGMRRAGLETDAALRERMRTPPGGVTRASILAAADAVLTAYGAGPAVMIEWCDEGFADVVSYGDYTHLVDPRNAFLLIVPLIGDAELLDGYADHLYADDAAYAGSSGDQAPYLAIINTVNQLKAAGVRWALEVNASGDFHG